MGARSLFVACPLAVLLAALAVGCTTNGDAGSGDPEFVSSQPQGVCGAASDWTGKCASAKVACDDAIVGTCDGVSKLLNASVLDAAASCLKGGSCDASPTKCLAESISKAEIHDAHKQLAEAFCGCLPTGKDACTAGIDSGDGPAKAALAIALPLGDDLANAIKDACTGTFGCSTTFSACAQGVVAKKLADALNADSAECLVKSVLGAATSGGSDDKKKDDSGGSSGSNCTPKTCSDLGLTCGTHDDGCGGTVDCGACSGQCQRKTCADLGKSCGQFPDGCFGTVDCGPCAPSCSPDADEDNGGSAKASDLGASTDSPDTTKTASSLTMPDGDEDWFTTKVSDTGFDGNPRITAKVDRSLEVSAFYVCDNGGDASYCPNTVDQADTTIGNGCRGTSSVQVKSSCSGLTDSGTAYLRVRKLASDGQCVGYGLTVLVE